MPLVAKVFASIVISIGMLILLVGLLSWESYDTIRYLSYCLVAVLASGLRIMVPGMTGTLSLNFLFILIGILELTLSETIVMGCGVALIQCVWKPPRRPTLTQVYFNLATLAIAIGVSHYSYHVLFGEKMRLDPPVRLLAAAAVYFLMNTFPVSAIIALTEGRPILSSWRECYHWAMPYYLAGAAVAGAFSASSHLVGWQTALLVLPVIYLIHRSYRLYLLRLESEANHSTEMASLHMRTIEALALAIEAKDHTTHSHLERVQVYAVEVGRELGLPREQLEALRAAAVLHDIGKLAVPEHIISKPGRLTKEEFEKMKIHPIVGAEILERVQFPYPVVPIVRAHHEKWNGKGYPDGLKGEEIPIGARVLAVADALDALSSDRQYRKALPLDEAMAHIVSESGKSYDPRVVEVFERRYRDLERKIVARSPELTRLSTDIRVENGVSPAAGLESSRASAAASSTANFLALIAAAREEAQAVFEIQQELGNSLSLDEAMSVFAGRLKKAIAFDAIAVYLLRDRLLRPVFVSGENFRLFGSLEIPVGQGLSGWVADNRKPILNGNPSVEPGYLDDPTRFSTLRSALAVPLEGVNGVAGVLALYKAERDAFSRDNLRVLQAVSTKLAFSVENALKFKQAESSAGTDFLTGLLNARALFLHLDGELARCRRLSHPLAVLVCDLDGFKMVNDRFGHLEGNRLLREVAQILKQSCREYDCVARMGGDEFVLVMPGMSADDLRATVDRLDEIVTAAGLGMLGERLVSLSAGEAHFPDDGADAEQLLAEADRRMYKAKELRKLMRMPRGFDFDTRAPV